MSQSEIKEGRVYHNGRGDLRRIDKIDHQASRCWYSSVTPPRSYGNHPRNGSMSLHAFQIWAESEHKEAT